ncbi:hypothetical protein SAMN02744133_1089 [Thalassospira xiamenensis M-5 = DSM 17429]|uniref:Uncharacterized protein n=1 Tax=Thalassospira xiamenensis M-5 = DSM 17429 TaxID=1123366 RepID=A0AB72UJJ1_9PROT|nr:hypothetical protein [Thalassospira xiamenensis]AJD54289.1 hypothetical protein TH3_21083 [Thalassospira xiamenensis M-5 = DSM 17429]SIT20844.1 hypothetical protein SAMN02744133_1089 [Thalassospira xiamenensis M-5 = DSM 17429]
MTNFQQPKALSAKRWKELKERWFDPAGGTRNCILSEYNLSREEVERYLPKISVARRGRRAARIPKETDTYKELCRTIESGEFTTYTELTAKYAISFNTLVRTFGNCSEIKKRVVANNCPPCLSKSQYDRASQLWHDPDGISGEEIAQSVGVTIGTLVRAFGPIRKSRKPTRRRQVRRPKDLSVQEWKDLKARWFDPNGGTRLQIAHDYRVSVRIIERFLPPIRKARNGRTVSGLRMTPAEYQELCELVESGEFTTFEALTEKYAITQKTLRVKFGNCREIKNRAVAPDCPSCFSKSQYDKVRGLWSDPNGMSGAEIAQLIGSSNNTLRNSFGPLGKSASS